MPGLSRFPGNIQGMILMLMSTALATGISVTIRHLSQTIHPFEIFFLRQIVGLVLVVPWFMRVGFGTLRTERIGLHVMRGLATCAGALGAFLAVSLVPLAKVTSLSLTGTLFTMLGAVLILHERPTLMRWIALGVGIAGLLVVVRPGYEVVSLGVAVMLGSRIFAATSRLMAKSLSSSETSASIFAYTACAMIIGGAVPALLVWKTPSVADLGWIVVLACFGVGTQILMLESYRRAEVGAVEPLSFMRLVWAALFGYLIFAEVPSVWTWIGGTMIVVAITYLAQSESRAAGRRAPPEDLPPL